MKYNGGMLLFAERVDGAVLTQRAPHGQSLVASGWPCGGREVMSQLGKLVGKEIFNIVTGNRESVFRVVNFGKLDVGWVLEIVCLEFEHPVYKLPFNNFDKG